MPLSAADRNPHLAEFAAEHVLRRPRRVPELPSGV